MLCLGGPLTRTPPPPPPLSGTIDEVEEIVARARMWRWKPYGEVTLRFAQDAQGVLRAEWRGLTVAGHVDEVLKEVKQLKKAA